MPSSTDKRYNVQVIASSLYLPEQSDPNTSRFVFSYTILIENRGTQTATLKTRHWIITDGNNQVREVRGAGVVGEQPRLRPGESFRYTSGAQIETPVGNMRGSYQMVADDGTRFDAPIDSFPLIDRDRLH